MLRTTLLAMSAALLAVPALAQDRWDGADDLESTRSPARARRRRGRRQGL